MCFGVVFFSFTIGNLTTLVSQIDTREKALAQKLYYIDSFSAEAHLPRELRQRMRKVLEHNNSKIFFKAFEYQSEVFESLPLKLRCEVAMAMHHGALKTNKFFQRKDPTFIVAIIPLLIPLPVRPNEVLFEEGDHPSEVYLIIKGKVELYKKNANFKTITKGGYFGEIEVLFNQQRTHESICTMGTELLSLERNKFINVLDQYPEIADEVIVLAWVRKQ